MHVECPRGKFAIEMEASEWQHIAYILHSPPLGTEARRLSVALGNKISGAIDEFRKTLEPPPYSYHQRPG